MSCSPPPTRYNSKSFVEESKNLGKTFGTSRDYTPGRSYMMPQLNTPGPSDVIDLLFSTMERNCCQTVPHTACYQGERTSWRVRKAIILTQDLLPTVSQLNLCPISGRHLLSKYVDTKLGKIDTKSKRFEYKKDTVPGPLDYKDIDALSR